VADLVVVVAYNHWAAWLKEGDPAVVPPDKPVKTKRRHALYLGTHEPVITPGERVYIVSHGRLRGYAPLIAIEKKGPAYYAIRGGGAVAVTLPRSLYLTHPIERTWSLAEEIPFPQWREPSGEFHGIDRVIREAREALDLTRKQVCERMDWVPSRLMAVEKGTVGVRVEDEPIFLAALELDAEALERALAGAPIELCLEAAATRRAMAEAQAAAWTSARRLLVDDEATERPIETTREVAGITLTWSRGQDRMLLEAKRGPQIKRAAVPMRPNRIDQRRLMDEAEAAILRAFGIDHVIAVSPKHKYAGRQVGSVVYEVTA
jgi:transcriptional regulator with XRE-family HTH domain